MANFVDISIKPEENPAHSIHFSHEDALAIWNELSGSSETNADSIVRLIDALLCYTIPVNEARHIGLIFNSFNGRIDKNSFMSVLAGPPP